MRYTNPAAKLVRAMSVVLNGLNRKRLNVDELSDHMRRDLGLADGLPRSEAGFGESDGRSRNLDQLTLTRFAA